MLIAFEGVIDRWLWEALTGEEAADSLKLGSQERHDAFVRRRVGIPLLNTIKPKDLSTAFAPHKLIGFWDHRKHKHDAPFKPGHSAKERAEGGYVFELTEDQYASLDPIPSSWRSWLAHVGHGKLTHLEQLFDHQTPILSMASAQLALALDITYGRAPMPEKVRAKANKKFAKAVKSLGPESTELHVWDLNLEAVPDLTEFPHTLDLSIGYNDFTILDGLSAIPKVEKLSLENSSSLVAISEEVGQLKELRELNLSGCSNLLKLPESLRGHAKLEVLDLYQCPVALDIDMLASFPKLKQVTLPRGFYSTPSSATPVEESRTNMAKLGDKLRNMRPDMVVRQFEEDLRMHYWL